MVMTVGDCMFLSTFWCPNPVAIKDWGIWFFIVEICWIQTPHHPTFFGNLPPLMDFIFFVCMGLLFVNKLPVQYECLTTDYNLINHTWTCSKIFVGLTFLALHIVFSLFVIIQFFLQETKTKVFQIFSYELMCGSNCIQPQRISHIL